MQLNLQGDGVEHESFAIISVYENKYYLQLYLDNYANKIVNKQMIDYLNDNIIES